MIEILEFVPEIALSVILVIALVYENRKAKEREKRLVKMMNKEKIK